MCTDERIVGDLRIELDELAVAAEAGVVDQQLERRRRGARRHRLDAGRRGEVGDQNLDLDLVRGGETLGQRLQPLAPPGDDDQIMARLGELDGERLSDARGGAGDESERSRHGRSLSRSCRSARVNVDVRVPSRPAIGNARVKLRAVRGSLHD